MMRSSEHDESFWEDLLELIQAGNVIPIIGEGAVTYGPDDKPLYDWLAQRLAAQLKIEPDQLSPVPSVNEVVCAWLIKGGSRNVVYTRLQRILREECPLPGPLLHSLAAIPAFNLYLTTTFDPLLQNALNAVRFGGQSLTQVCAFYPEALEKDLPVRRRELPRATVYHILGKVSPIPDYVAWEEDILEFICALQLHIGTSVMGKLARDLKEHGLLMLGLNFSDWLVRFFLRITKQTRLSEERAHTEYLAEGPAEILSQAMVLFFDRVSRNVHVIPCKPSEFARELARRWAAKYPPAPLAAAMAGQTHTQPFAPPEGTMPRGAIFISYAREDTDHVMRLKAGLEHCGCLVWYDRERLKAGDNWHNHLEDEVKKHCALFISVISRTTEHTSESYYHLERNWAQERFTRFSQGQEPDTFYVPVIIDDTRSETMREPRIFREIQAVRLLGGAVTPELGGHLRALQDRRRDAPPRP